MFGGRRAVILKSHGLDLLREKEHRGPGEWGGMPVSLGPASCCFSALAPPQSLMYVFIQELRASTTHRPLCEEL